MTGIDWAGWVFAFFALAGAATFFWRERKVAGLAFIVVFIVMMAGISDKRVVVTSAMLGLTLERDAGSQPPSK